MKTADIAAQPVPPGCGLNARGAWVPLASLSDADRQRDVVVRDLFARVDAGHRQLARLKTRLFADTAAHVRQVAETWGVRVTGRGGSVVLISIDGLRRVERVVSPRMRVTADVLAAEAIVSDLLATLTADADPLLRALVSQLFRRDGADKIAPSRLLEFIRMDLDDDRWRRAQAAVRHAIQADGEAVYFRAYRRSDPQQPWEQVTLDFSRIPFEIEEAA